MAEELHVLMLEDEPADAEFAQRELRKGGIAFTALRIEDRASFLAALDEFKPDIILADYKLPSFDGLAALRLAKEKLPEVPFVFVSGAMGEEFAIETLHQGAADYVLKGHLSKLVPAVNRALQDADEHRRREEAEASLKESEERFRNMAESAQDGIVIADAEGAIAYWNAAAERMFGYRHADLAGMTIADVVVPATQGGTGKGWPSLGDAQPEAAAGRTFEAVGVRADGRSFPIELSISTAPIKGRWHAVGIVRDISERKRAEVALRRSNRFLRTLSRCNETLVHAVDEAELLQDMCRVVVEIGEFALAWVGLLNAEGAIQSVAQYGSCSSALPGSLGMGGAEADPVCRPAAHAVKTGETQVVQDIDDAEPSEWRQLALACGYRSAVSLPLRVGGAVVGALNIYAAEQAAFGAEEVGLLSELAGDLGFGIAMLRVRAERAEGARKLERALEDTIQAIATTIEARDPYTAGHQKRVAQLAGAIAREMGLPDDRVTGVLRGAEIHDIGKIYIPSEILSRPGRLSATEFNLIKIHPQVGYDIIKEIDFPWPVAAMVLQHHERLDGSGYPNGLRGGDQIILEARILAVADVVDAMVSHRPYRAALGPNAALEEIQRNRGVLYDEAIVDICVALFRENKFAFS